MPGIAEGRSEVFGLGQVDPAEVAFGEHDAFGAQPVQLLVAEVVADELAIGPDRVGLSHAVSRAAT